MTFLAGVVLGVSHPADAALGYLAQEKELTGGAGFGETVAIDDGVAVVGAGGQAIIFERDEGGVDAWGQVAVLTAPGAANFGVSVAISGDTVVVGASLDATTAPTAGAAFLFERDAGGPDNWGQVKQLLASDGDTGDRFGSDVAIDGDAVLVAAINDEPAGFQTGSVYVFERDAGGVDNWGEVKKLVASNRTTSDDFGTDVTISGDTAVVSAPFQGSNEKGAAYIFERDSGGPANWGEVLFLRPPSSQDFDQFGRGVSLHGDTLLVGSIRQLVPGPVSGAAFLFERDLGGPDAWGFVKILRSLDLDGVDLFSTGSGQVSIRGDTAVIGARNDEDVGPQHGSAYVFKRNVGGPDNWGQTQKITPSENGVDRFGSVVATDGTSALVGTVKSRAWIYTPRTLRAFVTSADYGADFGGLGGGDEICRAEAAAEAVPGDWMALLSVLGTDRFDRVPAGRPIVRLDRAALADDALDWNGPSDNPLEIEPDFGVAPGGTHVWTGDSDADGNCVDFSSTVGDVGQYGSTSATTTDWFAAGDDACTLPNRLYCFRFLCPGTVDLSCNAGFGKGSLVVKESKAGKEKVKVDLKAGPALSQADLGGPLDLGGTSYAACIYDDAGDLAGEFLVDRAGGTCAGKPCWLPLGGFPPGGVGYLYKDKDLSADGVQKLQLKGGSTGKSKLSMTGKKRASKGQNALPVGIASRLLGSNSATVQLRGTDLGNCFSVTLDEVKKSTAVFFNAKK